jgi:hypothetical protein
MAYDASDSEFGKAQAKAIADWKAEKQAEKRNKEWAAAAAGPDDALAAARAALAVNRGPVGHSMDMPGDGSAAGGLATTVEQWCKTDARFAGVEASHVLAVLREAMNGVASLEIMGCRGGDIEFGRSSLMPGGLPNRTMTIEDVIARAKALRTPKKEKTNDCSQ